VVIEIDYQPSRSHRTYNLFMPPRRAFRHRGAAAGLLRRPLRLRPRAERYRRYQPQLQAQHRRTPALGTNCRLVSSQLSDEDKAQLDALMTCWFQNPQLTREGALAAASRPC
jgi:hypothetical protein